MRYFFDFYDSDGDDTLDDTGVEFNTLQQAKLEAAIALAEYAKDILSGETERSLCVKVRVGDEVVHAVGLTMDFDC